MSNVLSLSGAALLASRILSADAAASNEAANAARMSADALLSVGFSFAAVAKAIELGDESGRIVPGSLVGDMSPADAKCAASNYTILAADLKKQAADASRAFKAAAFDALIESAEAAGLGAAAALKAAEADALALGLRKAAKGADQSAYECLKKRLQRAGDKAIKAAEAIASGYILPMAWQECGQKAAKAATAVAKAATADEAKADILAALAAIEAAAYAVGYTVADVVGLIGGTATAVAVAKAAEADAAEAIMIANVAKAEADKAKARKAAVAVALNEAMSEDNPATVAAKAAGVAKAADKAEADAAKAAKAKKAA